MRDALRRALEVAESLERIGLSEAGLFLDVELAGAVVELVEPSQGDRRAHHPIGVEG
jgi:hypothetical protein